MALQKAIVPIEIAQGIDTKTDDKLVPAGKALVLENARFQKTGRLSKRFGLTPLPSSTNGPSLLAPECVLSTNKAIGVAQNRDFFSFDSSINKWINTSFIPKPFGVSSEFVYRSGECISNDYAFDSNLNRDIFFGAFVGGGCYITYRDITTDLKDGSGFALSSLNTFIRGTVAYNAGSSYYAAAIKEFANGTFLVYIKDQNLDTVATFSGSNPTIDVGQIDITSDGTHFYISAHNGPSFALYKITYNGVLVTSTTGAIGSLPVTAGTPFKSSCLQYSSGKLFYSYATNTDFRIVARDTTTLAVSIPEKAISKIVDLVSHTADASNVYITASGNDASGLGFNFNRSFAYKIPYTTTFGTESKYVYGTEYFEGMDVLSQPVLVNGTPYGFFQNDVDALGSGYFADLEKNITTCFFASQQIKEYTSKVDKRVCKSFYAQDSVRTTILKQYRFTAQGSISDITSSYSQATAIFDILDSGRGGTRHYIGESSYLSLGKVTVFDSTRNLESGFDYFPKIYTASQTALAGSISNGTYNYVVVLNAYNTKGDLDRSAVSAPFQVTITSGPKNVEGYFTGTPFSQRNFNGITSTTLGMVACIYRTENNGSVFYKVKEVPFANSGPHLFFDNLPDAAITDNEVLYTTGGVLQSDPTPQARFSASGGNRLFLGGLENKDEIAFSKKQLLGECVAFSDFFRIRISTASNADKSDMSALGYLDGKLIIFREQSIYYIQGDGPLETGLQDTFTEPEVISSDAGCVDPRSVLNVPMGIMFKSRKGIYLLDRSLSTQYIGAPVEDFNGQSIVASIVSDKFNEARFYTDQGNCLVYNYLFNTWSVFKNQTPVDADIWQGSPVSLVNNKVVKETENTFLDDSNYYSMKLVTPWLKMNAIQGFQRVYQLWIIGNYKSIHTLKMKVYVNYVETAVETYDLVYNPSSEGQYQFTVSMPVQKVESIKFELYDTNQSGNGESFDLSNLQAEVGIKSGGYKLAPNKTF